jgi:hypothetical protein
MMKPDTDIDTEKYGGHNIHNNMFSKIFYVPDDIKKNSVCPMSPMAKINFMAARNDIRRRKGVMGQWVDKKISYYTFLPPNYKFSPLNCTFPPSK